MIAGIFYEGSGLGDQLFRYITVRILAEEKKVDFGMFGEFKGEFFPSIYSWNELPKNISHWRGNELSLWNEKAVRDENGLDIRSYDPEINFVEDNTIIDGSFEDDKYWRHNLGNISKWLEVERLNVPDDTCVIGFRGGEYATQPDLFLSEEYYIAGKTKLETEFHTPNQMHYQVHTDDPTLAKRILNGWEVVDNQPISHSKHTNMGFNWRSARHAKYAVIPNSAFFILPRILKHQEDPTAVTIAPRYWARRNTKTWARPACYYPEFTYL